MVATETINCDTARHLTRVELFFWLPGEADEVTEELVVPVYFLCEFDASLKYNGFAFDRMFYACEQTPFSSESPRQLLVCPLNV